MIQCICGQCHEHLLHTHTPPCPPPLGTKCKISSNSILLLPSHHLSSLHFSLFFHSLPLFLYLPLPPYICLSLFLSLHISLSPSISLPLSLSPSISLTLPPARATS